MIVLFSVGNNTLIEFVSLAKKQIQKTVTRFNQEGYKKPGRGKLKSHLYFTIYSFVLGVKVLSGY
jgi:hypothetical protein